MRTLRRPLLAALRQWRVMALSEAQVLTFRCRRGAQASSNKVTLWRFYRRACSIALVVDKHATLEVRATAGSADFRHERFSHMSCMIWGGTRPVRRRNPSLRPGAGRGPIHSDRCSQSRTVFAGYQPGELQRAFTGR